MKLSLRAALAGLAAAGVALGVAEVVAVLTGPLSSPLFAVGGVVVDNVPAPGQGRGHRGLRHARQDRPDHRHRRAARRLCRAARCAGAAQSGGRGGRHRAVRGDRGDRRADPQRRRRCGRAADAGRCCRGVLRAPLSASGGGGGRACSGRRGFTGDAAPTAPSGSPSALSGGRPTALSRRPRRCCRCGLPSVAWAAGC